MRNLLRQRLWRLVLRLSRAEIRAAARAESLLLKRLVRETADPRLEVKLLMAELRALLAQQALRAATAAWARLAPRVPRAQPR